MDFNEYQEKALETAMYPKNLGIYYTTLGLSSEAGEVSGKVKKVIRDNGAIFTQDRKDAIMDEISDTLWYCATLSHELGFSFNDVAEYNIKKLSSRKEKNTIQGSGDNR